jgi:hypothetical protein
MKELSQQERRRQVYMKSLLDAVAESARNQKLSDLFKAEHQREQFVNALNVQVRDGFIEGRQHRNRPR